MKKALTSVLVIITYFLTFNQLATGQSNAVRDLIPRTESLTISDISLNASDQNPVITGQTLTYSFKVSGYLNLNPDLTIVAEGVNKNSTDLKIVQTLTNVGYKVKVTINYADGSVSTAFNRILYDVDGVINNTITCDYTILSKVGYASFNVEVVKCINSYVQPSPSDNASQSIRITVPSENLTISNVNITNSNGGDNFVSENTLNYSFTITGNYGLGVWVMVEHYIDNTIYLMTDLIQKYNTCNQTISGSFVIPHVLSTPHSLKVTVKKYDPKYNQVSASVFKEEFNYFQVKSKASIRDIDLWILAERFGNIFELEYWPASFLSETDIVYRNEIINTWVNLDNYSNHNFNDYFNIKSFGAEKNTTFYNLINWDNYTVIDNYLDYVHPIASKEHARSPGCCYKVGLNLNEPFAMDIPVSGVYEYIILTLDETTGEVLDYAWRNFYFDKENSRPSSKFQSTESEKEQNDFIIVGEDEITLYPNPSNGIISFRSSKNINNYKVEVYSLTGVIVYSGVIENSIDLSEVNNGLYVVKFENNNHIQYKKIQIKK